MCGFLGGINVDVKPEILSLISHRGPDHQHLEIVNEGKQKVILGHTRLSIIDLSAAGNQPMVSDCGNYMLVYNGEIYNHLELRKKLNNVHFKGHCDTETILYYLKEFGIEGVKDFNGIFAFALLDKKKKKLFLARDPFGIKPLYYSYNNNQICFSSELKVILRLVKDADLSYEHLFTFLKLRYNPSPQTLFKNIFKLEPGHYMDINIKDLSVSKPEFYSYIPEKNDKISENDALEQYDQLLNQAVKRQLLSDVPISILLSGGIDSALLTSIALKISGDNFKTYTAGYTIDTDINELEDARVSAEILGTEHSEILIEQDDFYNFLPRFIEIIEEPLGSQSIIPMYYLSENIHKDGFKVVLSGQGVDEPWGGYPKYNPQHLFDIMPNHVFKKMPFLKKFAKSDRFRRAMNAISESDRLMRFIEVCSVCDDDFLANLMNEQHLDSYNNVVKDLFKHRFEYLCLEQFKATDALMFFDTRMNLSDDLLLYTDKISMHHSLEVRVPFLDIELMKFVESLPFKYKVDLFSNKKLHKKLAQKYLPKKIIYRKKKHFATPRKQWFKTSMGKRYEEMMLDNSGIFSQLFNKRFISQIFEEHRNGKVNYEKQLYVLICIYLWLDKFVDR